MSVRRLESCGYQLAAHGQVEDGLAQGFDLVGAGGERGEVVEGEGDITLENRRLGIGCVEARQACRRQPIPRRLPLSPRRLQPVAEHHQFIDFGDDAVLFGEGWKRQ